MKNSFAPFLLFVFIFSFFSSCSKEESDPISPSIGPFPYKRLDGNLWLRTQSAVNKFKQFNYTNITGSVYIGGVNVEPSVVSLVGLESLKNIGDLIISNTLLQDMKGLQSLDSIKSFELTENEKLKNLEGLSNASFIKGNFIIENNEALEEISALKEVKIGPTLRTIIISNPNLLNLHGLEGLTAIHGDFFIEDNLYLQSLEGLNNLNNIRQTFSIYNNSSLHDLMGLQGLESSGGLSIDSNLNLVSLEGLENFQSVTRSIIITNHQHLRNFCALTNFITQNDPRKVLIYNNYFNPWPNDYLNGTLWPSRCSFENQD